MPRPQTAICAESSPFALFLTLRVGRGAAAAEKVRKAAAALPAMAAVGEADGQVSAVGFGAAVWERLFGAARPAELEPFRALRDGRRVAPATPADVFVHIHSSSHDANFMLARRLTEECAGAARVVEEVHGFRHDGGRDLTGFVDGTENPKGRERKAVALVGAEDGAFAGGSYVSVQRWVHDLARWRAVAVAEQEKVIGRTKAGDVELADDVKPPTAHIARVVIEEDGRELEILRHSMPYGTTAEAGLYFVAYARSAHPFRRMLENMVVKDGAGHYDHLMRYTRPVSGASFFCPSLEFLRAAV